MLKLDELIEGRQAAGDGDPSSMLLDEVKAKKKGETDEVEASDGVGETPEESGNPEPDDPEAAEQEEAGDEMIETEGAAKAWLRGEGRTLHMEAFGDDSQSLVSSALAGALSGVKYLAALGVRYGPGVARNTYRIVATTAVGVSKFLYVGGAAFAKFMKRRRESAEKLQKQIDNYREVLSMITEGGEVAEIDVEYPNTKLLSEIISTDFPEVKDSVDNLASIIQNELIPFLDDVIREIRGVSTMVSRFDVARYTPDEDDLIVKKPRGFAIRDTAENNPMVKPLRLSSTLPGGNVLEYDMPLVTENNSESANAAYRAAKMRLAVDKTHYVVVDQKPYLQIEAIGSLLDSVEKLLKVSNALESKYRLVMQEKSSMRQPLRLYFNKVFTADKRLHLQASMLDVVYLRTLLIDRVYLVGVIDTHDFIVGVIAKTLRVVNDHLRAYA